MYYIMSEPHGNENAYFDMKERIKFGPKDELYILGDVLGGNPTHPEQCLRILDDIMQNDNIHLILGDFEYAYAQYDYKRRNKMQYKEYKEIMTGIYGGSEFIKYMDALPKQVRGEYIEYLFNRDVSKLLVCGQRAFYLVHGAPVICMESDMAGWQKSVVQTSLDFDKNYKTAILSDWGMRKSNLFDLDNLIVIAGHISTKSLKKEADISHEHEKVIFKNNRFLIHCGCYETGKDIENTLCCLAIDEIGEHITIHYRYE